MCDGLRALQQSMVAYASGFDARRLSPADARTVLGLCARIESSAAAIKALAGARVAETRTWETDGYRSAADQLADQAGMSPSGARRALQAGQRMAEQPAVAAAALSGMLSADQAAAVADGVAADPDKASELIDKARDGSLAELNEAVGAVKAAACDLEERRRKLHERRSAKRWTDRDGASHVHVYGHPEDGALLWRVLDPIRRRLSLLRREAGLERDTFEALDYDALMIIASVAAGKSGELSMHDLYDLGLFPRDVASGPPGPAEPPSRAPEAAGSRGDTRRKRLAGGPIRVMVRVDLEALLRGAPTDGELCEIDGYGTVPVSVVEDLLATESPFIVGVLTKGRAVTGVYHHGRVPSAHQRSALDFLQPVCAAQGCSSRAALQYDHREDWAKTRITAFDLLDRLCPHHHRLKTTRNWALAAGRGKRPLVPPGHVDHPGNRVRAGPSPGATELRQHEQTDRKRSRSG